MKIPREINSSELVKALAKLRYRATRQTGLHIRVTTEVNGQHHDAVPNHRPTKTGTLHGLLKSIAGHHQITVEVLLNELDL